MIFKAYIHHIILSTFIITIIIIIYNTSGIRAIEIYGSVAVNGEKLIILKCNHVDCGNIEKVWLPYMVREHHVVLKSHPYCINCGMVKNIGSDRAVGKGYFINALSQMEKHLKLPGSNVRMRLVAKDLEKIDDFEDAYSMSKYAQEKIFIKLIKKYYSLSDRTIQQFL